MRAPLQTLLIVVVASFTAACGQRADDSGPASATIEWIDLHVDGLANPADANAIETALGGIDEVLSVSVDTEAGIVSITTAATVATVRALALARLGDAGFHVQPTQPTLTRNSEGGSR